MAFCETVKKAGYEPGVYFNRYIGYYGFDLSRLNSYKFWLAVPGDFPDFYYAFDIWQYSFEETIPGDRDAYGHEPHVHPQGAALAVTVCGGDTGGLNPVIIIILKQRRIWAIISFQENGG